MRPIHTAQWFSLKKEKNSYGGYNGDEPRGHYAESNGSHRMTNALISVTGGPESTRFEDGKEDGWLPRAGRSREWGTAVSKIVCFTEWKVMAVGDGDNGCWTIWMYLVPLNCTDGKSCYVYFTKIVRKNKKRRRVAGRGRKKEKTCYRETKWKTRDGPDT